MVVCLVRLMPSTVCSYPMASSTWSCPKDSMSLMWMYFTHATGLCVAWIGLVSVGRITGVMGANVTIHLSEAPVRLHYTCPIYHSLYSNWQGFKDSSISADSGHERVGMMGEGGGGGGGSSPSRCSCIYTSPEASCVPTQYCGYTHG